MDSELQGSFEACLDSDLAQLMETSVPAPASKAPPEVEQWDLPDSDIHALRQWGVPIFETGGDPTGIQLQGDVQRGNVPLLNERDLHAYLLGRYWRRRIGAIVHHGTVIGLPDDTSLNVSYLNSSVSAFIEISWRWKAAKDVLHATDDIEQLYGNLHRFQEFVHGLDPLVGTDPRYSWWDGILEGW